MISVVFIYKANVIAYFILCLLYLLMTIFFDMPSYKKIIIWGAFSTLSVAFYYASVIIFKSYANTNARFFMTLYFSMLLMYILFLITRKILRDQENIIFGGQWYLLMVVCIMSDCFLSLLARDESLDIGLIIFFGFFIAALNLCLYIFYSIMMKSFYTSMRNRF